MWIQMNSTDGLSHAIVNVECVDDSADISRAETVSSSNWNSLKVTLYKHSFSPESWKCLCKLFIQLPHTLLMAYYPYGTY